MPNIKVEIMSNTGRNTQYGKFVFLLIQQSLSNMHFESAFYFQNF